MTLKPVVSLVGAKGLIPESEAEAVNILVDAQKASGEMIDPAGARRLIRALVALCLLKFDA